MYKRIIINNLRMKYKRIIILLYNFKILLYQCYIIISKFILIIESFYENNFRKNETNK